MKKSITALFLFIFSMQTVLAATVHTPFYYSLSKYNIEDMEYALITAEAEGEVTAEHGLNFLFEEVDDQILWNDNDITVEIDNGEGVTSTTFTPVFDNAYKVLHVPLEEDLVIDGTVKVIGMKVRTYGWTTGSRYVQVDLDGDLVSDVEDGNGYRIGTDEKNNIDPPYQIADLEYTVNEGDSILFTWVSPPDYDYEKTTVGKYNTTDGVNSFELEVKSTSGNEYLATNHGTGDSVTYRFYSRDYMSNPSEPVVVTFDLPLVVEEPVACCMAMTASCLACTKGITEEEYCAQYDDAVDCPAEEEPEEEPVDETEEEELSRLLNYYTIRYSIKCMPSGVPAADNDSACLWARIDLIYAQDILDVFDTDTHLSDFDIHLMTIRRQYPEARYQDNCVDASEPASYCSALGKAMDRVSYFLD